MNISLVATLAKRLGAVCFLLIVLWHAGRHAGLWRGRAIVHVAEPEVTVNIGARQYRVVSMRESPLVCELEPGVHMAEVWRRGKLVGQETFVVESGKDVVVYPLSRRTGAVAGGPTRPAQRKARPAHLVAHFRRMIDRPRPSRPGQTDGAQRRRPEAGAATSSSASSSESPG